MATRHMIAAPQLAALRTGATVINTARGALVDHEALAAEVAAGRLYAFLDTTDPEPLPPESILRRSPMVFLTPHLAGSEGTEMGRLAEHVAEEIRRWSDGVPAAHEVLRAQLHRMA
jgi:phosphoglycerate dehydrogenase-like enzyme